MTEEQLSTNENEVSRAALEDAQLDMELGDTFPASDPLSHWAGGDETPATEELAGTHPEPPPAAT